jgi:hypothetical protein
MKKGRFVEYVQHNLSAGLVVDDTEKKFPEQVIDAAIDLVIADLLNLSGNPLNKLLVPKTSEVTVESTGDRKYIELPYESVSGTRGVLMISPSLDSSPFRVYSNFRDYHLYKELQGPNMGNGLYPMEGKYFFGRNPILDSVFVTMYCSLSEYDNDDELTLGSNHILVYGKIIEMLTINIQRVEDRVNNQGPDGNAS